MWHARHNIDTQTNTTPLSRERLKNRVLFIEKHAELSRFSLLHVFIPQNVKLPTKPAKPDWRANLVNDYVAGNTWIYAFTTR